VKFKGLVPNGPEIGSANDEKLEINYKYTTGSAVRPQEHRMWRVPEFQREKIHQRWLIFSKIEWIYRHLPQIFFVIGLAVLGWRLAKNLRKTVIQSSDAIGLSLLIGMCSYALILTVLEVTSYAPSGRNLFAMYPIVLAFILNALSLGLRGGQISRS